MLEKYLELQKEIEEIESKMNALCDLGLKREFVVSPKFTLDFNGSLSDESLLTAVSILKTRLIAAEILCDIDLIKNCNDSLDNFIKDLRSIKEHRSLCDLLMDKQQKASEVRNLFNLEDKRNLFLLNESK